MFTSNIDSSNDLYTEKKTRSSRYNAETITDVDYADDLTLTNTPAEAEFLLHSLEKAVGGISLHVNANKTEYVCFKREGTISTLSGWPLKLVEKFTYLGSNILSTESDVSIHLRKAWIAIDWLSVLWNPIK